MLCKRRERRSDVRIDQEAEHRTFKRLRKERGERDPVWRNAKGKREDGGKEVGWWS